MRADLLQDLRLCVGSENVLSEPHELLVYECDGLPQHKALPAAVVFPRSTQETSNIIKLLANAGVAFAPRGAGTGLSGGALALNNSVIIECAKMRRLINLDAANRTARVETGIINAQVSRAAAKFNLHYVPDPASQATCTIGGNIAENAGGIHCLKYGMTGDHILAAQVVLPDGEIVEFEADVAPYDLLGLFTGSEGTFGIATEATVKLTPLPAAVRTMLADFLTVDGASRAVSAIIAKGFIPAALEMIDGATIRAVEQSVFAAGLPTDAEAALLIELDGAEVGLDAEADECARLCQAMGARDVRMAQDEKARKKLWAARKGAFGAMGRLAPDLMLQDAVVPRSKLPEVLAATYRIGAKYGLRVANVFHAGDGNLHPFICFDSRDKTQVERVKQAGREMMETCVRAGGTITGEHGIGIDKSEYLPLIFGQAEIDAMLNVRRAFDSQGLCNPGKILPVSRSCGEARGRNAGRNNTARNNTEIETSSTAVESRSNQTSVSDLTTNAADKTSLSNSSFTLEAKSPNPLSPVATSQVLSPTATTMMTQQVFESCSSIVGQAHVTSFVNNIDKNSLWRVAPADALEAREILCLAYRNRWRVIPAGNETLLSNAALSSLAWNQNSELVSPHIILSARRLNKILEHAPADLIAIAEAGVTVQDFNLQLANSGQWLPLDALDNHNSSVTLGALAATNASGALAATYGAPRAHVIGMKVLLGDGTPLKLGGRVVKNVAGYDLCKLFTGSRGSLGMITEITFKVRPAPRAVESFVITDNSIDYLLACAAHIRDANIECDAVELLAPHIARQIFAASDSSARSSINSETFDYQTYALLVRLSGSREAINSRTEIMRARIGGNQSQSLSEAAALALWQKLATLPFTENSLLPTWHIKIKPTQLPVLCRQLAQDADFACRFSYHVSCAAGIVRLIEHEKLAFEARRRLLKLAVQADGKLIDTAGIFQTQIDTQRNETTANAANRLAINRLALNLKAALDDADIFPLPLMY